ncbi:MAG: glycosyltransferase, partial [Phycisphaerae bacterium]|nr:glycosyltransferase [Phycisphaerae bacterium]
MRVLIVNYEFPPIGGGAGKANLCLLRQFSEQKGINIDVLTSGSTPGLSVEGYSDNINIHRIGITKKNLHFWTKCEVISWLLKACRYYKKMIKTGNYDLVHAFFAFPSGLMPYRSRKKLPYIISLRGSDVPGYNERLGLDYKLLSPLFRRIWHNASAVIANSKGLASLASQFAPDLEIGIIHNGIHTDKFIPAEDKEITAPLKLLTVCRLIKRKRIDLMIEALAQLNRMGIDAELDIIGDGNIKPELVSHVVRLGLSRKVNFQGRVPPELMPAVYRDSDIFL